MPGIVGRIGDSRPGNSAKVLFAAVERLRHEKWYGVSSCNGSGWGFGKVSLDRDGGEFHPVCNEDESIHLVMDGEIFDYQKLKGTLISKGHLFRSDSQPEFVLHLFEEFGEGSTSLLNGAFVIAIWDNRAGKLTIFNDRFGLHPLYYAEYGGLFVFASTARALLADEDCPRSVDLVSVAQLLCFEHVLGNRTLLADVSAMPPASVLTYVNGSLSIRTYWHMEYEDNTEFRAEDELADGLVYHLRQAVARQAPGDTPAGVLLSGGLDSRIVVASLRDVQPHRTLHTFTFGIPGCDDARYATEIAGLIGSRHHFMELSPDYLLHLAEEGVRLTDGLQSCVHMHALANLRAQAEHVRVIYKGYLGDVLMGSNLKRHYWSGYDRPRLAQVLLNEPIHAFAFHPQELERLFAVPLLPARVESVLLESLEAALSESESTVVANIQNRFDLQERQRRHTLNGVELVRSQMLVRTPFCDNDLVSFMQKVPPRLRLDRYLCLRAFARAFPDLAKVPRTGTGMPMASCVRGLLIQADGRVRWRLRSAGLKWVRVPVPRPYADYATWMRTVLRPWIEKTLLDTRALDRGYFNPDGIRNLLAEHMSGADHSRKLGMLLTLELWHRQFIDQC